MMPEKPKTQGKMIEQMWFAIFGTNGSDGIVSRIEHLEKRPSRVWDTLKDVVIITLSLLVLLFGTGVIPPPS
jgi:hypothetical protein